MLIPIKFRPKKPSKQKAFTLIKIGPFEHALLSFFLRSTICHRVQDFIIFKPGGFSYRQRKTNKTLLHSQSAMMRLQDLLFLDFSKTGGCNKIPSRSSLAVLLVLTPELVLEPGKKLWQMNGMYMESEKIKLALKETYDHWGSTVLIWRTRPQPVVNVVKNDVFFLHLLANSPHIRKRILGT